MSTYTAEQFKADLQSPYAWPGGYPRYFICADGEALSFEAAQAAQARIVCAINEEDCEDWRVIGCDINWEDTDLYCAHSGERIESAYAD